MIMLTKLNNTKIVLNCAQIESVELIPESKILMTNGKFYIVKEGAEEIIEIRNKGGEDKWILQVF